MSRQGCNSDGEPLRDSFVIHDRVQFTSRDDGMTRQEFAAECDINNLLSRYERTGVMPGINGRQPAYLDLTAMPSDLMGAMQMMEAAAASFMQLPAVVRKEFDNDPVRFVEYACDPSSLPQLRAWGLAAPEKAGDASKAVSGTQGTSSDAGASPAPLKDGA